MTSLPTGTVTFLFSDIEGSTRLWERFPQAMPAALARHDALVRDAIETHRGVVFKTVGDAFCAAFATAPDAFAAALVAQRALAAEAWGDIDALRVRIALHTDTIEPQEGDYFGSAVNRVARLLAAGSGGQTLLSAATRELVINHLPVGAELRDLGEHRLKDLQRAERIYQLVAPNLPSEFPPLRTLDNRPNNLPAQPSPLIGRGREVAAVCRLLRDDGVRLLTLTGPGGAGKTRVGLQVAAEMLDDFPHGVFFVPLARLSHPALVPSTVAQVLQVRETAGRSLGDSVRDFISDKQMLLLLDNFEQVITAVPFVTELLAAAPRLKVLTTSRSALRVYGEHEYPVPPLAFPDLKHLPAAEALAQYPAVALFTRRAQAVDPGFALSPANAAAVAEICAHLDGLPLAIELAAARVKTCSPQAMLARWAGARRETLQLLTGGARDLPARQQTLRAAMDWSFDLLEESECRLFTRLAVFVGGCSAEAAEVVTQIEAGASALDRLASLVDKSLLRQSPETTGEPRFTMLETLREYALEKLAARGETDAVMRRHAEYYLALAEAKGAELRGPRQMQATVQLEREHDNLRAALGWALEHHWAEMALRLTGAIWRFWQVRGYFREGRQWLESALAKAGDDPALASLRAKSLDGAGVLAFTQSDYEQAKVFFEQGLALCRAMEDGAGIARTLNSLGAVEQEQGRYVSAQTFFEESLGLLRELGDRWGVAGALNNLGLVALHRGDYAAAEEFFKETLHLRRELGDQRGLAFCLTNLGVAALYQDEFARATALTEESLALFRELGNTRGIAAALTNLGRAALGQGDAAHAAARHKASLALFQEIEDKEGLAESLQGLAGAAVSLAKTRHQRTAAEHAARWLGAVQSLRETIGTPPHPAERADYERKMAAARACLGEGAFTTAWTEGYTLGLARALADAQGISFD